MESYRKEEIKVGVLVLTALIVMGVLFAAVLGLRPGRKAVYRAHFQKVAGLEKGSPVNYAGFQVGRVKALKVDEEREGTLEVALAVDRKVRLPQGTVATIDSPLFGSTTLELRPGEPGKGWIEEGAELPAEEPFDLTAALKKVEGLIDGVGDTVETLTGNLEGATDQVKRVLAAVEDLLDDENRESVGNILAGADDLVTSSRPKVDRILDRIETVTAKLDEAAESARATLRHAESLVQENRDELEAVIESTLAAVEQVQKAVGTVDQILSGQRGNLEETIVSLREASANMVELTRTLKERPWMLVRQTKPRGEGSPGGPPPGEEPAGAGVERKR